MSDPPKAPGQAEPASPRVQRRIVTDSEYRTSYIGRFQIRVPTTLHARLVEMAQQQRISMEELVIATLQEAVGRRERPSA